jgi:hypothetical protein
MNNTSTFSTERLPLAISVHASGRLRFVGCERTAENRVEFLFHDNERVGSEIELEFDRGTLTVVASEIFASQKYLRRRMSEALENRRKKHGQPSK